MSTVPRLRKSWSTEAGGGSGRGGGLRLQQRKALHRCRQQIVRLLDVGEALEGLSADDGFQAETRDFILGFATSEQRVAALLDRLEMRSDRSFRTFLEVLKAKNDTLYQALDEALKAEEEVEESAAREKTVTGEDIRRIIHSSLFQPANLVRGGRSADVDDLDAPIGAESSSVDLKKRSDESYATSDYLDCYCIPLLGKVQNERWIKYTAPEVNSHAQATTVDAEDKAIVVLTQDITFIRIDAALLPASVCRPPANCTAYVVDVEDAFTARSALPTTHHLTGEELDNTLKRGASLPSLSDVPPDLPPVPVPLPSSSSADNIVAEPAPTSSAAAKPPDSSAPPVPPKPSSLPSLIAKSVGSKPKSDKPSDSATAQQHATDGHIASSQLLPPSRSTSKKRELVPPKPPPKPDSLVLSFIKETAKFDDGVAEPGSQPPQPASKLRSSSPTKSVTSIQPVGSSLPRLAETNGELDQDHVDSSSTSVDTSQQSSCRESRDDKQVPTSSSLMDVSSTRNGHCDDHLASKLRAESLDTVLTGGVIEEENPYEPIDSRTHRPRKNSQTSIERGIDGLSDEGDNQGVLEASIGGRGSDETSRSSSRSTNGGQKSPSNDSGLEANMLSPISSATIRAHDDEPDGTEIYGTSSGFLDAFPDVQVLANDESSDDDNSYYEHIDALVDKKQRRKKMSVDYLDPHEAWDDTQSIQSMQSPPLKPFSLLSEADLDPEFVMLPVNSIVLSNMEPACLTESATADLSETDIRRYKGTCLTMDKKARCFYIPAQLLKKYGDPSDEPWFYPVPLSSRQATLFIGDIQQDGCFIVYEPVNKLPGVVYNLSVGRCNGDVLHYHIKKTIRGDLVLEGHDRGFVTSKDLVEYFQRNRSRLAVRLRRPLKYALLPITAGLHYDSRWEINRARLKMSGKIVGKGNFGVVCVGTYNGQSVAVKVLQKAKLTAEDEDDFVEEAQVLMRLNYEHVVRLVGMSCSARPYYLVTEFVKKGSLRDCLRNSVIPSGGLDLLFDLCLQATAAMVYLEGQRFVLHRDVAARNFLVSADLGIKLADFGRARYVTDDVYQAPRSETLSIKWAASEVLTRSLYSTKSDVWALGIVFWEIFSRGERPYAAMSTEQAAMFVVDGGRLEKPSGCPTDIFALMKMCWLESRDARPSFATLYSKLSSKFSIYYSTSPPLRPPPNPNRGSVAHPVDINLPKLPINNASVSKSKTIAVGSNAKSSDGRRKTVLAENGNHRVEATKSLVLSNSVNIAPANTRKSYHESSSETSLGTIDRDDLSRGDKIRKSLRKMMNLKPKKSFTHSHAEVNESTGSLKKHAKKPTSP